MDEKSHILATQLFYELKQLFSAVPDNVVKCTLREANYVKEIAIKLLTVESQLYTTAAQGINRNMLASSPRIVPPVPAAPPVVMGPYVTPMYNPESELSQSSGPQMLSPAGSTLHLYCNNNLSQVVAFPSSPTSPGQMVVSPSGDPQQQLQLQLQQQQQKRASTSVSLVLQPSPEQVPYVSYTTAAVDPQRGMQSHLQITISNQGGSITAIRGNPTFWFVGEPPNQAETPISAGPGSIHPSIQWPVAVQTSPSQASLKETIMEQTGRREKMQRSLRQEEAKLEVLQRDVHQLQEELTKEKELLGPMAVARYNQPSHSPVRRQEVASVVQDIENLKDEIRNLELDCQRMVLEIENYGSNQTAAQGQNGSGAPARGNVSNQNNTEDEDEEDGWNCSECTLRNHPALNKCEACETPRSPATSSSVSAAAAAYGAGGGGLIANGSGLTSCSTSDIHIHVRRRHVLSPRTLQNWVL